MGVEFVAVRIDRLTFLDIAGTPDRALQLLVETAPAGDRVLKLDTAWHGIHVVLTGDPGPTETELGSVIMGGEPVDDTEDAPRLLAPDEVALAAAALRPITDDYFRELHSISDLTAEGVYPAGRYDDPAALDEYLLPRYRRLRQFIIGAADAGDAVIAHIG